jgi:hypothetical protein
VQQPVGLRRTIIVVGAVLVVLFLLFTKFALFFNPQPGVVPDEFVYQTQSYYFEDNDPGYGNLLHSLVYRSTVECGPAWYQCVKALNLVWEVIFASSLAWLAHRWLNKLSLTFGIFTLIFFGPFLMYGQFFMPESMLAAFLTLAFVVLNIPSMKPTLAATLFGLCLAVAMLTKPHAFFVFLGLVLYAVVLFIAKWGTPGFVFSEPLFLGLLLAITLRSILGIVFYGLDGLNPIAAYSSTITDSDQSVEMPVGDRESGSISPLIEAGVSFFTNLLPGLFVLLSIIIWMNLLTGNQLRNYLSDRLFAFACVLFFSLLLMAGLFGALLEFRNLEETMFRAITRYWEYSLAPLLIAALVYVIRKPPIPEKRTSLLSIFALVAVGAALLAIPREQTQADSGMLYPGAWVLVLACLAGLALSLFSTKKLKASLSVAAFLLPLCVMLVGVSSTAKSFSYSTEEKAGYSAGMALLEELEKNPSDSSRITFVGDRISSTTAAFTAKLPSNLVFPAGFYSRIPYSNLPGNPRWVVASKEVFILGEAASKRVFGDMVVYEFGYPATIQSLDFQRLGVEHSGVFANTYWGSWVLSGDFSFRVPKDVSGDTLEILLLANEEIQNRTVEIDFGDGPIQGQLEEDQIVTPVILKKQSGASWSETLVSVRAVFSEPQVLGTKKKLGLGFAGFKVYDSGN